MLSFFRLEILHSFGEKFLLSFRKRKAAFHLHRARVCGIMVFVSVSRDRATMRKVTLDE